MRSTKTLILATLVLEGALIFIYLLSLWIGWATGLGLPIVQDILVGVVAALILLMINVSLLSWGEKNSIGHFKEFTSNILIPLAQKTNHSSAAVISIAAGVGEELFFRGLLQPHLGLVISNLIFAAVHFGPLVTRFKLLTLLYFLVGLYLGALVEITGTLWAAIVCHSLYDYLALLYLRRRGNMLNHRLS